MCIFGTRCMIKIDTQDNDEYYNDNGQQKYEICFRHHVLSFLFCDRTIVVLLQESTR